MQPTFPNHPGVLSKHLLSKITPRSAHSPERLLVILSCQIDEFSPDLSVKTGDFQSLLQNGIIGPFEWFSKSSFIRRFSHLPRDLEHFADSNSIP